MSQKNLMTLVSFINQREALKNVVKNQISYVPINQKINRRNWAIRRSVIAFYVNIFRKLSCSTKLYFAMCCIV